MLMLGSEFDSIGWHYLKKFYQYRNVVFILKVWYDIWVFTDKQSEKRPVGSVTDPCIWCYTYDFGSRIIISL